MELINIENFRLIERNKAAADTFFNFNNKTVKAELLFYLQGNACLGIRVGRHDAEVPTKEIKEYIRLNKLSMKKRVNPDVIRVKEGRLNQILNRS
ncbi:MAG TPA: hypothetical protein VFC73_00045 [Syntrophomonadaceae bacterium]|nr:hypothetical protein [Syntrophomonadaceae bacterium]